MSEITPQIILINKPYRWTSFDVVKKIKGALARNLKLQTRNLKIGHAGTLDPLATGLLILCTGKFTKRISEIQAAEKEYTGTFFLGATTASHDLETPVEPQTIASLPTEEMIHQAAKKFLGTQMQHPPAHSAVKIKGRRAYQLAHEGKEVKTEPKEITISEFEITAIHLPEVYFKVVCSKGTYIRSLAYDFGKELQCGAYLSSLCRTRIGAYLLKDALEPEAFISQLTENVDIITE